MPPPACTSVYTSPTRSVGPPPWKLTASMVEDFVLLVSMRDSVLTMFRAAPLPGVNEAGRRKLNYLKFLTLETAPPV